MKKKTQFFGIFSKFAKSNSRHNIDYWEKSFGTAVCVHKIFHMAMMIDLLEIFDQPYCFRFLNCFAFFILKVYKSTFMFALLESIDNFVWLFE